MNPHFTSITAAVLSLFMLFSCTNTPKQEKQTEKTDAEKVAEKLVETGAFGEWSKEAAQAAFKTIGINLSDLKPAFEYLDTDSVKTHHGTVTKTLCDADVYYLKKDLTAVSFEDFLDYTRKVYAVAQKTADDGKIIYGFELKDSAEEALAEFPLEEVLAKKGMFGMNPSDFSFAFKKEGKIIRMEVKLVEANLNYPERLKAGFSQALQKSFKETMDDAEKALEKLDEKEIKKAIKDAVK